MKNLSIILPYRDSGDLYRERIFDWMLKRYEMLFPLSEIVICDSGDEVFNRSKSRNIGVKKSKNEYLLIADADTLPYKKFVEQGIYQLDKGSHWLFLYDELEYYNADKRSSERILNRNPIDTITPREILWEHKITAWAGQILIRKSDFFKAGGYDERFTGWGYEDNAFQVACDVIIGGHSRIRNGWTIHIWHPYSHQSTFGQPMIDMNRNLYKEYLELANNKNAMIKFVGNRG